MKIKNILLILSVFFIVFGNITFAADMLSNLPVQCDADSIQFDHKQNMLIGSGNVKVQYEDITFYAERVTVNIATKDIIAEGNVKILQSGKVFTGERALYNYETKKGEFDNAAGIVLPWYGKGEQILRLSEEEYEVHNGYLTTCDYKNPHYRIKAKRALIYPGDKVVCYNILFYIAKMPVLWLPKFTYSLTDGTSRFTIIPGRSKKWGAFLLTSYDWLLSKYLDSRVRLDYREKKGFGGGLDFDYRVKGGEGTIRTYFAHDKDYILESGESVEEDRYKIEVMHYQQIFDDTTLRGEFHYLSDKDVLKDFFRGTYEDDIQPSTYIDLTKSNPRYSLDLYLRKRVNNFYTVVEQTPSLSLDIRNQRILETPFYYKGTTSVGKFEMKHDNESTAEDYDSVRFDTYHLFSYPKKYFGWLEINPRAGTRQTWYSKDVSGDGIIRGMFITGVEFGTKIFRVFDVYNEWWNVDQLRHVIEPRVNYTYIHAPSVAPERIPQFSSIDDIEKQNSIRLSLRNKLQTKRNEQNWNLLDLLLYTDYYPDPDTDEDSFSNIFMDFNIKPFSFLELSFEGSFDQYNGRLADLDSNLSVFNKGKWNVSIGHRYEYDSSSLLYYELDYRFNQNWAFRLYQRYEIETNTMEEQEYTLYRDLHCWQSSFSFRKRGDETEFWIVFWLTAYPDVTIDVGN